MNPIEVVAFCVILICAMIPIVKEYLDEDELQKFREELHKYDIYIGEHKMTSLQKRRLDIQTKDLVEVVRCKDCIHFTYENDFQGKRLGKCNLMGGGIREDGYCYLGESKE